jgi:hypothetical protein
MDSPWSTPIYEIAPGVQVHTAHLYLSYAHVVDGLFDKPSSRLLCTLASLCAAIALPFKSGPTVHYNTVLAPWCTLYLCREDSPLTNVLAGIGTTGGSGKAPLPGIENYVKST